MIHWFFFSFFFFDFLSCSHPVWSFLGWYSTNSTSDLNLLHSTKGNLTRWPERLRKTSHESKRAEFQTPLTGSLGKIYSNFSIHIALPIPCGRRYQSIKSYSLLYYGDPELRSSAQSPANEKNEQYANPRRILVKHTRSICCR
ncbi:hypothetical protein L228DRAFT_117263 [Xylona heveae TC161]|uniref:Secreted protein n=1 Tax=Xylona heveae (strain CBS 132557 / TC161) TaxID=1328760 RepID=A0A165HGQ0_XYLHT|nr:hypothetical protein L228DRAFT_117263 [Xylona heveae TC161]KZF23488.1 hypothetical protein L228DRAFT_117263 [Xylona heveae TC161]